MHKEKKEIKDNCANCEAPIAVVTLLFIYNYGLLINRIIVYRDLINDPNGALLYGTGRAE